MIAHPAGPVAVGKQLRDQRKDLEMVYKTCGLPGTSVQGVQERRLDKAVHCITDRGKTTCMGTGDKSSVCARGRGQGLHAMLEGGILV